MLAILFISMCLVAVNHSLEVHYCYYCSTSLSGVEPLVQRQVMNQRLFYYPTDAIQTRCHGPSLSRHGKMQICSEPMCVSINAQIENVNFTVLGCADTILRPSVKLPERNEDHCIKMGMSSSVDFTLCYCSSALCNVDGPHSSFKTPKLGSTMNSSETTLSSTGTKPVTKTLSVKKDLSSAHTVTTGKSTHKSTIMIKTSTPESTTMFETSTSKSTTMLKTTALLTTSAVAQKTMHSLPTTSFAPEIHSEENSGESFYDDEHSTGSSGVPPNSVTTMMASSHSSTKSTPLMKLLETTVIVHQPTSNTAPSTITTGRKVDYDPEEQEVVELNSEEMERRASIHSEEYALYNDLGSPEEEFLYTTPHSRRHTPVEPGLTSPSIISGSKIETTTITAKLPELQDTVTSHGPLPSTTVVTTKWLDSTTVTKGEPQNVFPLVFVEPPVIEEKVLFEPKDSDKVSSTDKLSDTSLTTSTSASIAITTTTPPMVLEQGLSINPSGSVFGSKTSSPVTSTTPQNVSNSTSFPSNLNTKKFGAISKVDQNITMKTSKFSLDKENRQIADSPSSHLSDESKESFKSSKELDHFPKKIENPPVTAAHKTHNISGLFVIVFVFLSLMM